MSTEPAYKDTPEPILTENTQGTNGQEPEISKSVERLAKEAAGQRLRTVRKQRKLMQTELAKMIGVTQTAISRYELGLDIPGGPILQKLLTALEINYLWYIDGVGPRDLSSRKISKEALRIAQALDTLPAARREEIFALIIAWMSDTTGKS